MMMQGSPEEWDELRSFVRELHDKDQIRDCLYRYSRAVDRIDEALLLSVFHDDAVIDYGVLFKGGRQAFVEKTIAVQLRQVDCQHLIGNILIDINGDEAAVESYEIGRHLTPLGDHVKDMVLASRILDHFERRDGAWKVVYRKKVLDWVRFLEADRSMHENSPIVIGRRDEEDPSYALFDRLLPGVI